MDSAKIPGNDFLDILFDGRNKDYGAYALRSRYDNRVRNAVMGTASIVLVIIGGYVLNNTLMAANNNNQPVFTPKTTVMEQLDLPKEEPVIPPPPVNTTPPPAAPRIDFANLVVKPDNDVREEDQPPKISDIGDKTIALENAEGDMNGIDDGPVDIKGSTTGVVTAPVAPEKETPLTFVEIMPEFPGGEEALLKYLGRNIHYPVMAQESNVEGTISIQFVVNKDGTISDVKTQGAHKGAGLEEEAMRVVRSMPKWRPGKQNGKNVAVYFNLPVKFALSQQ